MNDFFNGIKSKYPLCCIIRYCVDSMRGHSPALVRDKQYSLETKFDDFSGNKFYEYVPCGIFHKGKQILDEHLSSLDALPKVKK